MENTLSGEQKPINKEILDDLLKKSKAIKEKAKEAAQRLDELKAETFMNKMVVFCLQKSLQIVDLQAFNAI